MILNVDAKTEGETRHLPFPGWEAIRDEVQHRGPLQHLGDAMGPAKVKKPNAGDVASIHC